MGRLDLACWPTYYSDSNSSQFHPSCPHILRINLYTRLMIIRDSKLAPNLLLIQFKFICKTYIFIITLLLFARAFVQNLIKFTCSICVSYLHIHAHTQKFRHIKTCPTATLSSNQLNFLAILNQYHRTFNVYKPLVYRMKLISSRFCPDISGVPFKSYLGPALFISDQIVIASHSFHLFTQYKTKKVLIIEYLMWRKI